MSEQGGRYTRSTAGMVTALVVAVAVVIGFVVLRDLSRKELLTPVRAVDYAPVVAHAERQLGFDVLAPAELPRGWRATSVRFTPQPARWHLGLLTDENEYVGVEQARSSVEAMVHTHVDPEAVEGDPVTVRGRSWRSWTDEGGDTALVREHGEVVVLVVGSTERDVLLHFAAALA